MRRPHRIEGLQLGLAAGERRVEGLLLGRAAGDAAGWPAHHRPRRAGEPTPDPTPFTLGADNDEVLL